MGVPPVAQLQMRSRHWPGRHSPSYMHVVQLVVQQINNFTGHRGLGGGETQQVQAQGRTLRGDDEDDQHQHKQYDDGDGHCGPNVLPHHRALQCTRAVVEFRGSRDQRS